MSASHEPLHPQTETPHIVPVRTYVGIFAALLLLTALTTAISYVDLGPFNTFVALAIAIIKATLVVLFFMHLLYSSKLTRVILGTGLFWLVILLGLTLSDYMSRGWLGGGRPW